MLVKLKDYFKPEYTGALKNVALDYIKTFIANKAV